MDRAAGRGRNVPPRPVRLPHPRHTLAKVGQKTVAKDENTVIESSVDVQADIDAINRGEGVRRGDAYEINGRTYRLTGEGHTYPLQGEGFHRLDRQAFKALRVYNQFGNTARAAAYLAAMNTTPDQRASALRAWQAEHGGHRGT